MKRRTRIVLALLPLAAASLACKREESPAPELPASETPTTVPADRQNAGPAQITISDQVFTFAPAKLLLRPTADGIAASLYSETPAAGDDRRVNSFSFTAQFDAETPADVSGQQYHWQLSVNDMQDSTSSIFLNGHRQTVRPLDATLTLTQAGGQWTAVLSGEFQYIDNQSADDAPVRIHASAEIVADAVTPPAGP